MRSWLVIAIACAASCRDARLAQLEQIKDAVCGCTSIECAEAAMKAIPQHDVEMNHRAQQIALAMLDCLARLGEPPPAAEPTDRGSADPAAGGRP